MSSNGTLGKLFIYIAKFRGQPTGTSLRSATNYSSCFNCYKLGLHYNVLVKFTFVASLLLH